LKVKRASCLKNFESFGISDPYVQVIHFDEKGKLLETHKTKVVFNKLDPVWDETFEFRNIDPQHRILLEVYDFDLLSHHDLMGRVDIQRKDIAQGIEKWFVLTNTEQKEHKTRAFLQSLAKHHKAGVLQSSPYGAVIVAMDVIYQDHK